MSPETVPHNSQLNVAPASISAAASPRDNHQDPPSVGIWLTVLVSVFIAVGLAATGKSSLLRIEVPLGATLTAFAMVSSRPLLYLHFALWTWFLTPLLRRLIDWRFGFEDQNFVLTAPLLVSSVAVVTLLRRKHSRSPMRLAPFGLCTAGLSYGLAVGLIRSVLQAPGSHTPAEVIYEFLYWMAPMLLGLYLCLHWTEFQENKQSLKDSFLWVTLLLGAYGVYQYLFSPPWDTYWLRTLIEQGGEHFEAFGFPEPFRLRVWGSSNAPATFANILMFSLLAMSPLRSRLKPVATAFGYAAFLLTLCRTAWVGWLVALILMCRGANKRQIVRLLMTLAFIPFLLSPLLLIPEAAESVRERAQSFVSLKQDESALERQRIYRVLFSEALREPFGTGLANVYSLNNVPLDSGLFVLWFMLGPLGSFLYLAGIINALWTGGVGDNNNDDYVLFRAIALGMFVQIVDSLGTVGVSGALFWVAIGYVIVSRPKSLVQSTTDKHLILGSVAKAHYLQTDAF